MNKFLALIIIIVSACFLAGLYGIIHDQITYIVSPEYYTKFKFYQFGLADKGDEAIFSNPRLQVSIVGFMATWWMGIPIGIILGLVGLIHSSWKVMIEITLKAFFITMILAFLTGLYGLAYGHLYLANKPRENFSRWFIPDNLIDFENFIKVGSMHNYSYLGGLIGLVGGICFITWKRIKLKRLNESA